MTYRIILLLIVAFALSAVACCQDQTAARLPRHLTVGITYNPFLAVMEKKHELGPSVSFGYPINKRWEAGIQWFSRQVIYAPDNAYRQLSNLRSSYNLESVYSVYLGVTLSTKRTSHLIAGVGGVRNDLYKETLENPRYDIRQTFRNNEWNVLYGLGYTCRFRLSNKSALSARLFMPLNRHPFDDVIKYSFEPGFVFKL